MKDKIAYIKTEQKRITILTTKKFGDYYLTGGTTLSFCFNHRFSEDLDFFSQHYKKEHTEEIMHFISDQTGFKYRLDAEQNKPGLAPMKVYFLALKKNCLLKIDFVQDFAKNINKIKNGLHSIEDVYYRKISIATGGANKQGTTGRIIPTGRQSVKDLFDLYYLSCHHQPLSDFFFEYFSYDKAEPLIAWYNSFDRITLKLELLDLAPNIDTAKVIKYLDSELLKKIPDKLI